MNSMWQQKSWNWLALGLVLLIIQIVFCGSYPHSFNRRGLNTEPCRDVAEGSCETFRSNNLCLSREDYILENCKKSCEFCGPDNSYMDTNAECPVLAKQGYCKLDKNLMEKCPYSCRKYKHLAIISSPSSASVPAPSPAPSTIPAPAPVPASSPASVPASAPAPVPASAPAPVPAASPASVPASASAPAPVPVPTPAPVLAPIPHSAVL